MKKWVALSLVLVAKLALAQETLPLYPGGIPGAIAAPDDETVRDPKEVNTFLLGTSRPTMSVYVPKSSVPTPAVIIFPGGSYRGTSIMKEGYAVAEAFNKMGVAAFVVKYRTPNPKHMTNRTTAPLQDAQQAMRLVRSRAAEWNLDAKRIGIVGFSAGGHLAATAAMKFDQPVIPGSKTETLRPDFVVLAYPVISMSDDLTHSLSRTNLLGEAPSADLVRAYSMELNVNEKSAPVFLMHAADDKTVKVANSIRFFEALQAKGISTELHVYPKGGHGFGLDNATTTDRWIERVQSWLESQGMLTNEPK